MIGWEGVCRGASWYGGERGREVRGGRYCCEVDWGKWERGLEVKMLEG